MKSTAILITAILSAAALSSCQKSVNVATTPEAPAATASAPAPAEIKDAATQVPGRTEIPVPTQGAEPLLLGEGQTLVTQAKAPKAGAIRAAAVQIGNFEGTSDGALELKICQGETCRQGTANLAGSSDNEYLTITFDAPLDVAEGAAVDLSFKRAGGVKPFAVWSYAANAGSSLKVGDGAAIEKSLKLALDY